MPWLAPLIEAVVTALATVLIRAVQKKEEPEKTPPCPEAQAQQKLSHQRKRRSNKRR